MAWKKQAPYVGTFPLMPPLRALVCTFLLSLFKPAQSSVIWRPQITVEFNGNSPAWHVAMLLGAFIGLMFMAVFICMFIPTLMVTWTTAIILQVLFGETLGRRHRFVADSCGMAMDMCRGAAMRVVREGKLVAFVACVLCFLSVKKL